MAKRRLCLLFRDSLKKRPIKKIINRLSII
ncbi:MAG: hypothetical protein ACI83B_002058 [Sediminicola sp.]